VKYVAVKPVIFVALVAYMLIVTMMLMTGGAKQVNDETEKKSKSNLNIQ
jgi:hypothetical protein